MSQGLTRERVHSGWKPALCLFLLAPITGELITSSAPPSVFFIPWVFLLFALLYGCGAILVREAAVRWNTGWRGVLLLGAAYGILEEGLGAKSFFDPHWRALGALGSHGRWMGVNWVWSIGLILFHAGFCMGMAILATELAFPRQRGGRWLGSKSLALVGLAYSFVLLLFFQKGNDNGYEASPLAYWICLAMASALVIAAARSGSTTPAEAHPEFSRVPVSRLAWLGFLSIVAFVFLLYGLPSAGGPPWVTALLLIALATAIAMVLARWTDAGRHPFGPWQEYGLVAGSYGAFAVQAPLQEWNRARADSARGMTFVGIACCLTLVWLRYHLLRNELVHRGGKIHQ